VQRLGVVWIGTPSRPRESANLNLVTTRDTLLERDTRTDQGLSIALDYCRLGASYLAKEMIMHKVINKGTKFENVFAPAHITIKIGDEDIPGLEIPLVYFHWDRKSMLDKIAGFNFYSKYTMKDIVREPLNDSR
jgi:hypothetical protein